MQILQSKLEQPRRPGIMHRERLTRLFDRVSDKKLVTVLAGAGFGKTTMMIDVAIHLDILPVWYRLDEQDRDFHVFVSYLYALFDRDFKTGSVPNFRIKSQTEILIDWLALVEATVSNATAVILDDYHLVQASDRINQAVEFILQRLPAQVLLVIMGRKQLPLSLSGLRAKEQMIEISERELFFSNPEIQSFFHEQQGMALNDIHAIYETGQGWAAGLVLLRYAVAQNTSGNISTCIEQFQKYPEHIFSYLKEHIFDPQPDKIRRFMMKIALLPEIDTRLCSRIFEIQNAGLILNQMVDEHLFLFPGDDAGNRFFLHHLFRDFLLTQLHQTFSEAEILGLHYRIAKAVEQDDVCLALDHYISARRFEQAVQLIKAEEIRFMIGGHIQFLGRQIRRLPQSVLAQNPELLILLSRLFSHYGTPRKAIALIQNALKLFRQNQATEATEEVVACVVELASQYYFSGHLKEARLMMEQVLDIIPENSNTYIIAMTYLTFLCSVLGDIKASEEHDRNARDVIGQYLDYEKQIATALIDTSRSHTLYFSGDFEQSQRLCHNLLGRVTDMDLLPCLPLVYYQLSANAYFLHDFQNGCDYARRGIEVCERIELTDSRKAWVYIAWAQNCLGLERFDDALEKSNMAIHLLEEPGNRWGLASVWENLALVYLKQKRPGKARKILGKALSVIKGYGLTVTQAILENRYAAALLDEKQFQEALERLEVSALALDNAAFHRFSNLLLTARANAGLENFSMVFPCLEKAFELAATHSYDRFLLQEKDWLIPLIHRPPPGLSVFPSHINDYLNLLFNVSKSCADMKIDLLGTFRLRIDDRSLTAADFKSTKALMLLKYLAARRNRGYIHREVLIELLWPDQDPRKTSARFNMAMSALRKVLEPDLLPKAPSAYIDRKKDGYRLVDNTRIIIDTEVFLSLVSRGEKQSEHQEQALGLYLDAFDLYRSEFLEEDRFEEWCSEERFLFSSKYRAALNAIIRIYEQKQNWEKAVFYSQILLKENPLDEAAVEKLMLYFSKTGRPSKIKSTFDVYVEAAMKSDLPTSEKITIRFQNLV